MIVHLYSLKGGQGCSVTAALMMLGSTNTLLVDRAPHSDQEAILGLAPSDYWDDGEPVNIGNDGNQVCRVHDDMEDPFLAGHDHVIVDHSLWDWTTESGWSRQRHRMLMVIRNDYLSVRRAVAHIIKPDGIIVVAEPGRALQSADIEHALDAPVLINVNIDPTIARSVDAGLLVTRTPGIAIRLANLIP